MLSGEGGDELFGGYDTYAADMLAPRLGRLAALARPLVDRLPSSTAKASLDYRRSASCAVRSCRRSSATSPGARSSAPMPVRSSSAAERDGAYLIDAASAPAIAETAGAGPLARLQDVDLGMYLADDLLVKIDRASMAHSLEARVPYLDPAVTDFALALPDRLKVRGLAKKRLLRAAAGPLLPAEIVHGKKRGFRTAARHVAARRAGAVRARGARRGGGAPGLLPTRARGALIDEHVAGRADLGRQLWRC